MGEETAEEFRNLAQDKPAATSITSRIKESARRSVQKHQRAMIKTREVTLVANWPKLNLLLASSMSRTNLIIPFGLAT